MPLADRLASTDADAGPAAATGPLPPGHPQAAELERLRLLYERGALAGADYWAVRAYILEQAMRAGVGVGGGRGGPPPLTPRDRLLGGVLWAAGFMLVLLAAGGVWKAGELLLGRPVAGAPELAATAATPGPGAGFGGAAGPNDGPRGWSLEAGADWLLGRPPRPPDGFGPRPRAPFVADANRGFGARDAGPPGPPPDGFGRGFGGDAGRDPGPPGPPPDGFGGGFGQGSEHGFGPPAGRPPPR